MEIEASTETDSGDGKKGRMAEIAATLDELSPEELKELAREHSDTDGTYRVITWLEGKRELSDAEIKKILTGLPLMFYERQRKAMAKKLGVRVGVLDEIRNPGAGGINGEKVGQGTEVTFEDPEPWPDSVDGATLLDDLADMFRRYIVLPDGAAETLALWTAFTYLHDEFWISPILCLTSPEKRCGKTSLLAILGQLVAKPLPASNMTPATVYRAVEEYKPTLLIDEADSFLRDNEELRGVLNAGHLRSQAYVLRCVEPNYEVRLFMVWSPKAIALIGKLPPTLTDRAIVIQLQRKTLDEKVERLRLDRLARDCEELRRKLTRWSEDAKRFIKDIEVQDPVFLNDREADNWRQLLVITNAVSDSLKMNPWRERALEAARLLSMGEDEEEIGSLLLTDLKNLFRERGTDRLPSIEIVEALLKLEERPWAEYGRQKKPITQRQLASILKKYRVFSRSIRINREQVKQGYYLFDLEPFFMRYCTTKSANSLSDGEISCSTSVVLHESVADRSTTNVTEQEELEI